MKNKNLKYIKNIDMDKINLDSFHESLLSCVLLTKGNCRTIDKQVDCMTSLSFIPWMLVEKQYELIIERMVIKNDLIALHKLFMDWFKGLSDKSKKLFVAYFIKKDTKLCKKVTRTSHYYTKDILPIARNFMSYVKLSSNFDEKELIKNPFIYTSYITTLRRNEMYRGRGPKPSKGEENA